MGFEEEQGGLDPTADESEKVLVIFPELEAKP